MPTAPDPPVAALLADGHITADDPARAEGLARALRALAGRVSLLAILGDLFEVWLGVGGPQPHVETVARALRELRQAGVKTIYVEGNRDFAIGRGATAGLFDVVARREHVERLGGLVLHLSHGDLVNTADWQYRAWRGLSKRLLAPLLLRALPAARSIALAGRLEQRFRRTNLRHKASFPEAACRRFAARQVARGADLVVVGHFHQEREIELSAEGRSGRFLSLPFWHDEPRPVLVDAAGRRLA